MKKSHPRTFTANAAGGAKSAKNSGILSNSGAGQKMDKLPAAGPIKGRQSKADTGALNYAMQRGKMKTSMPKSGKDAQTVADYAINHGAGGKK